MQKVKILDGRVPTLDINDWEACQKIVDKEEGRYLGHCSSVLLSDGKTIFVVYVLGHGRGQGIMKKSTDGGVSWSERLQVPESWSTLLQVPTLYKTSFENGQDRLVFFTGHYPIRKSISEDCGKTWDELKPLGKFGSNVSMSDMVKLNNGNYLGFFHDDGRFINDSRVNMRYQLFRSTNGHQSNVELYTSEWSDGDWQKPILDHRTSIKTMDTMTKSELIYEAFSGKKEKGDISKIFKTLSIDGGLTWGEPVAIAQHDEGYLAEAGAIYSPDKKQIALIMRENTRKFNSFVSVSEDEGQTWIKPYETSNELTGDRHNICYAPDGRLVITFRDTLESSPTHGDWVAWVGTYDDLIKGRPGQYRIRLKKNYYKDDCGYAGLEVLEDGTFVSVTYGHWKLNESPYIICVRFHLNDLDAILHLQKSF